MRTVLYFYGGTLADFEIAAEQFKEFAANMPWARQHDDDELHKAREVLETFLKTADAATPAGPQEMLAACYVWNYFNSNPDPEKHIDDDIIIVDLQGDGNTIEFAAVSDVPLTREAEH